jgi:hypothetical protein
MSDRSNMQANTQSPNRANGLRLLASHGQAGTYPYIRQISTHKHPCSKVNFRPDPISEPNLVKPIRRAPRLSGARLQIIILPWRTIKPKQREAGTAQTNASAHTGSRIAVSRSYYRRVPFSSRKWHLSPTSKGHVNSGTGQESGFAPG